MPAFRLCVGRLRPLAVLLAASLASLSGCVPFSEPLSDEQNSVADNRILGRWNVVLENGDEAVLREVSVTFTANEGNRSLTMSERTLRKDGATQSDTRSSIITTQVGERHYISYRMEDRKTGKVEWFIHQYRLVSVNEVHVFVMDEDRVREEIRAGHLPGRPTQNFGEVVGKSEPVILLDQAALTPERLRAYFKAHPDDCFDMKKALYVLRRK